MSGALLGAAAGFLTALVMIGVPAGKIIVSLRDEIQALKALLTGKDATEGDGVIPRLRAVETAIKQSDAVDLPDTDGGSA